MRDIIAERLNLFIKNNEILEEVVGLGFSSVSLMRKCAALNLTTKNKIADKIKIEESVKIIKDKTSIFSNFRGNNLLNTAINIYEEDNVSDALEDINAIYKGLKEEFFNNQYLILAAQIIYFARKRAVVSKAITDTGLAYGHMKKDHIFLTGQEDICAAALIATTSINLEDTFREVEDCYTLLNAAGFPKRNELQGLCNMLSIINIEKREKCKMVVKMNNTLNNHDIPLRRYAMPLLGITPFICDDYDLFAKEAKEVSDKLKKIRGFGFFSISGYIRDMIAVSIVASVYAESLNEELNEQMISLTNNASLNIVIAMQIAAASAAAAAGAAAASSASN